jgi:hypothetical protein
MGTVPLKKLGAFLLAGALPLLADDAGKAAAKAYAHTASKRAAAATAKPALPKAAASARQAENAPGPGRMQVEEPSEIAGPGANASRAWQKSHPKGLTDAQRSAFRERKEKMEGMIALIKAKRQALREAKPEERAALARELHILILEKDGKDGETPAVATATAAARLDAKAAPETEAGTETQLSAEAQAQRQEELREREKSERRKARKAKAEED